MSSTAIGRATLERLLGRGGVGEVWEARLPGSPAPVALTLLRAPPDPSARAACLRDLRAASRVRSPHLAVPWEVIEADGAFGVAAELVRGRPITSVSPLRGTSLLDAALTMARALEHLHAHRGPTGRPLVHGALRPSCVLLDEHGRMVITDLGLRRVSRGAAAGFVPDDDEDDDDPRRDVFSLGAVVYALATESAPFGDGPALAGRHLEEHIADPTWLLAADAVAPGLGEVARRCLHPTADDRFVSAADAGRALTRLYSGVAEGKSLTALGRPLASTPSPSTSGRLSDPRQAAPTARAHAVVRASALEAAAHRMRSGSRFLFVDGPSGSGRTAFVERLIRRLSREHPGGTRRADAARCQTSEDLSCAVGWACGAEPDPEALASRVGRILARRGRLLLVIDDVDALGSVLPPVVHGWLAAAAELSVICTGTLPPPGVERLHLGPLSDEDVRGLWAEARGGFVEDEAVQVDGLGAVVEGRALALEVLARTPSATATVLARRLRDRLALTGGEEEDHTLRAALDVGAQSLPEWGRAGLGQLAVLQGPFCVAQAAGVLELSAWPDAPFASVVVALLAERGFLHRDPGRDPHDPAPARSPRWRAHAAVQRWAHVRASALDLELTRLRHREHHAELGQDDVERAICAGTPGWRTADVIAERWDILAALDGAIDDVDPTQSALLLRALDVVGRDHVPAARTWSLGREVVDLDLDPKDRVAAELIVAKAADGVGRATEAAARRQAALVAAAELGEPDGDLAASQLTDPSELASAWRRARRSEPRLLARVAVAYAESLGTTRPTEARTSLEEAVRAAERGQDPRTYARAAQLLGVLLRDSRDGEAAAEHLFSAITAWHVAGDPASAAPVEETTGTLLLHLGRPEPALRHLVSAATSFRLCGDVAAEASAMAGMGEVSLWCGRFDGALRHLDDAQRLQRRVQDERRLARTLNLLGLVHIEIGRLRDAREAFDEALAIVNSGLSAELQLGRLGVSLAEGRVENSRDVLMACLKEGREAGDPIVQGRTLWMLGRASFRDGHPDTARAQLESAANQLSGRSVGWRVAAELELANVLDAQGEGALALDILERSIAAVQAAGFVPMFALALCVRARLHLRNGRTHEAAPDVVEARQAARGFPLGARAPLTRALDALR